MRGYSRPRASYDDCVIAAWRVTIGGRPHLDHWLSSWRQATNEIMDEKREFEKGRGLRNRGSSKRLIRAISSEQDSCSSERKFLFAARDGVGGILPFFPVQQQPCDGQDRQEIVYLHSLPPSTSDPRCFSQSWRLCLFSHSPRACSISLQLLLITNCTAARCC